jgi:hypothetical protein
VKLELNVKSLEPLFSIAKLIGHDLSDDVLKNIDRVVFIKNENVEKIKLVKQTPTYNRNIPTIDIDNISPNRNYMSKHNKGILIHGYKRQDGSIVVNNDEMSTIKRIAELVNQKKSACAIAFTLNEEKIPNRYGRKWWHNPIKRIIDVWFNNGI